MNRRQRFGFVTGQFAAVACVAAYLLGGAELLPQLLAFGATLEGSHRVEVSRNEGRLTIALSHDGRARGHPGWSTPHRHGTAARVFCVFAQQASPQADHVASFATSAPSERPASGIKAGNDLGGGTAPQAFSLPRTDLAKAVSVAQDFSSLHVLDNLVLLRSTVLVI